MNNMKKKNTTTNRSKRGAQTQLISSVKNSTPTIETPKTSENKERRDNKSNTQKKSNNKATENGERGDATAKYAVVIKPKTMQNSNETIKDLNKKCNAKDLDLNSVKKTKFGTIIIECCSSDKQDEIKQRIESKIGSNYEISLRSPLTPKIKIFGITEQLEPNEIEDLLKRQNEFLANGDLSVLKVTNDVKDKDLFNAIVQIDKETFGKVMQRKRVLINWDSCVVREHHSILRCHKCCGFNHKKEECKNNTACGYCGNEHESNECEEDAAEKCVNCIIANEKFALNLDINHNVWSRKCEILNGKITKAGKRTEYVDSK